MMGSGLPYVLVLVTIFMTATGCGSSGRNAATRQTAYQSYGAGSSAFEKKEYQSAREQFTKAIDAGSLNIDILVDAFIKRAVCTAALGDYDVAHQDLDKMEQGAPNLDQVYAARSFVLAKEGRKKEAKAAWAKAKRFNRDVRPFTD